MDRSGISIRETWPRLVKTYSTQSDVPGGTATARYRSGRTAIETEAVPGSGDEQVPHEPMSSGLRQKLDKHRPGNSNHCCCPCRQSWQPAFPGKSFLILRSASVQYSHDASLAEHFFSVDPRFRGCRCPSGAVKASYALRESQHYRGSDSENMSLRHGGLNGP